MAEQRYQAVTAVIGDGLSISQVAEKLGVSRQTLRGKATATPVDNSSPGAAGLGEQQIGDSRGSVSRARSLT